MTADADVFLDTNVLLYASNARFDDPSKHATAQGLLTARFGVSGQVLSEFYANATRKGKTPLSDAEAYQWVDLLSKKAFQPVDARVVKDGIRHARRYQISYRDGAIVAAAERLGATTLYTEDLNNGQTYGSVTAINPFLDQTEA